MDNENKKLEVIDEATLEARKLIERIVPPHKRRSREVTEEDLPRILEESVVLYKLCFVSVGLYHSAMAMAHPQIDDKDPLRMYVTSDRDIVLNPVIVRHSGYMVDSNEGCMSMSNYPIIPVKRWRKVELEYVTIMVDPEDETKFKLSSVQSIGLGGNDAYVAQHEIDNLEGEYIYDGLEVIK